MREIKFRAWDKIDKLMAPVEELHRDWIAIPVMDEDGGHLEQRKLDDVVLMQSTGLFDKNGKEIWGGDVVHWQYRGLDYQNEVYFDKGRFWVKDYYIVSHDEPSDAFGEGVTNLNVIGNIWDNPELIK